MRRSRPSVAGGRGGRCGAHAGSCPSSVSPWNAPRATCRAVLGLPLAEVIIYRKSFPNILHLESPNRGYERKDRPQATPVQHCPRELSAPQGHGCEPGFGGAALRGAEVGGAGGPFATTLGEPPSFPGCTGPRRIRRPLPLPPIPQHADAWDTFQARCQPKDIESIDIMEEREFQRQDTNAKCRAEHGGVRVTGIGWVGTCFTGSY